MQPFLIDTHAHIYLPEFDKDLQDVIDKAYSNHIQRIFMPAIDASTHEKMLQVEDQYASCHSMMGLHPCSVNAGFLQEIEIVETYLAQRKFIAIGEIGLDFYWDKTFTNQQYQAFHLQIQMALNYNLPIAIHSRNATDECIAVISQYPTLRGVFHCFSGTEAQALQLAGQNFMLGIGGVVTYKNAGLDKAIANLNMENIILETDAPYLAPVPFRGKRNEPAHIKLVAEKLASIFNCPVDEVARITTANAEKLFGKNQNH